MCGIVGYIGPKEPEGILLEGLKRLEYRGYDSAGVAIFNKGKVEVVRAVGKLTQLEKALRGKRFSGPIGLGHTRWATHGRSTLENAHPHAAGKVKIVHNGIIENYIELKEDLISKGHKFLSETDTEVIVHLIDEELKKNGDRGEVIRRAMLRLKGAYALGVMFDDDEKHLYAIRNGAPLIVGVGEHEHFIASDIPAILNYTNQVIPLNDEEIAVCTQDRCEIIDFKNGRVPRTPQKIEWDAEMVEKGGYPHYMLKEIHEQPRAIMETVDKYIDKEKMVPLFDDLKIPASTLKHIERIEIVACGTSYYAGLVAEYYFEKFARIPTEVQLASEYRYRNPVANKKTLIIAVSQSGETADTLAAVKMGKGLGATVLALNNVRQSTISREATATIYTEAGLEIGVASTKAFTTQISTLLILALHLAIIKKSMTKGAVSEIIHELMAVPWLVEQALKRERVIKQLAEKFYNYRAFFYIGRQLLYPVALEGALKLKEISYISAEGYAAGEMKHGPIALVDQQLPVVCLATPGPIYDKVMSNIEEIQARDGIIVGIGEAGDSRLQKISREFIPMPKTPYYLTPIVYTIPVQLLAYFIAVKRGTDIDQPKNLAKSVTVE